MGNIVRTRPRTSIGVSQNELTVGFKTKSVFPSEALLEMHFKIVLTSGVIGDEYGYSSGNPDSDSKAMEEGARLNAVCRYLYRQGYFVDQNNYEELDLERVESTSIIDYNYYYIQNEFNQFETHKNKKGNIVMSRRGKDGKIRQSKIVKSSGRYSVRNEGIKHKRLVTMEKEQIKDLDDKELVAIHKLYIKELKKRKLVKIPKRKPRKKPVVIQRVKKEVYITGSKGDWFVMGKIGNNVPKILERTKQKHTALKVRTYYRKNGFK